MGSGERGRRRRLERVSERVAQCRVAVMLFDQAQDNSSAVMPRRAAPGGRTRSRHRWRVTAFADAFALCIDPAGRFCLIFSSVTPADATRVHVPSRAHLSCHRCRNRPPFCCTPLLVQPVAANISKLQLFPSGSAFSVSLCRTTCVVTVRSYAICSASVSPAF